MAGRHARPAPDVQVLLVGATADTSQRHPTLLAEHWKDPNAPLHLLEPKQSADEIRLRWGNTLAMQSVSDLMPWSPRLRWSCGSTTAVRARGSWLMRKAASGEAGGTAVDMAEDS